jgi:amidase
MTQLTSRSLSELVEAVSAGEVSATEVVQAHLDRIAEVNPRLNALTPLEPEAALAAAGSASGPLGGLPFTVKENLDVAGSPTTWGLPALAGAIAQADAPAVDRLRRAGGVPIARGNLPDFALRWHTDSSLRGATVNPWSPDVSPGGSSGGEAAAVASGMSPLGLCSDYGGSVRVPAAACGVVGLKPTPGRIPAANAPTSGVPNLGQQLMAVPGVIVRTVADAQLAYEVLAGADPRDPASLPLPGPLDADGAIGAPLRIGVTTAPGGYHCDPEVVDAIEQAANALATAGHHVKTAEPPIGDAADSWLDQTVTEISVGLLPLMRQAGGPAANHLVDEMMRLRPPKDLAGYVGLFPARLLLARVWSAWFTEYDVLVGPVSGRPTPAPGYDQEPGALEQLRQDMQLTLAASAMGVPAVSLPAGLDSRGAPLAVQIVSWRFRENVCLAVAAELERTFGTLTPPLSHP